MSHDHSKAVGVNRHHLQLLWPVLLRGNPAGPADKKAPLINAWADWFQATKHWTDPLAGYAPTDIPLIPDEYSYEETVYFHPFFRDFLMGDGGTRKRDLSARFLTRDDVKRVRVEIDGLSKDTFDVGRVHLHLLKPCVAVLCVEVVAAGLSLWEVQRLQDRLRRIYPPFWFGEGNPGLAPKKVTWVAADGADLCVSNLTAPRATFADFTRAGAEPPVCDHWQFFFGPLKPLKSRQQIVTHDLCYQQVLDERIPVMSYLAVPDPDRIAEGDFDRLTFVDDGNDSDNAETYPYRKEFLDRHRPGHTYDRFSHYGTTYLSSGYGFTVVGKAEWFFENIVRTHFRTHYFRMGLVAHYQRAALLYFSDELSNAIKTLAGKGPAEELTDPTFRRQLEDVQMGFLKFRSRAYFPEVTNQLQGQELWQMLFRHLNTQVLFDVVDASSQRITSVLAEHETRELARSQARLAVVASWGLGISIFFAAGAAVFAWAALYPEPNRTQMIVEGERITGPLWWLVGAVAVSVLAVGSLVGALWRSRKK